jgi:PAS domain S-box-containing protein
VASLDVVDVLRRFTEQSLEHAVLVIERSGRIAWANPGAEHIFGYGRGELAGRNGSELFTPEDLERGLAGHEMEVAFRNGVAEDDRWQLRRDRSRFWAVGAMLGVRGDGGEFLAYVKVLRDRTDLKEQIETLRSHAASLAQDARRKDTFISTLSHELRNPLAPLTNAAQLIRMAAGGHADIEYPLKVIERQAELLRRLVDDLLDMSRLGEGKVQLRRGRIAIQEVVRQAVDDTSALVKERGHAIETIMPDEPIAVDGDPSRLAQVFVNLVTNAAKYTPSGGRISVQATVEGDEVVVKVADNGVGIPHDMLPGIFDLFTQVESSRPLSRGGMGIGLSVVKDLVALHGGNVQVRSEGEGKGSEFTVRLPLAGDGARDRPSEASASARR